MGAFFVIIVIAAVVGGFVISKNMAAKKLALLESTAQAAGLQFSDSDDNQYDALGLSLFTKGDKRSWNHAMWMPANPTGARVFEYEYTTYSTDSKGNRTSSTTHHTVTLFDVNANCANLTIGPENIATRFADHVGMRDIEFESEEFNRAFNVKCPDRQFASALCDAQMMQWLMDHGRPIHFELHGGFGVAYTGRLKPGELPGLLTLGQQFRAAIPTVVTSLFPRSAQQS